MSEPVTITETRWIITTARYVRDSPWMVAQVARTIYATREDAEAALRDGSHLVWQTWQRQGLEPDEPFIVAELVTTYTITPLDEAAGDDGGGAR